MPDNNRVQIPGSEDQSVDYAFWDDPEAGCKIIYSLPLFHEIDFVVNEGYRKIPHGGIEVGGLLFGSIAATTVRIEAFRPIACEHASGPSWNLSERDLSELENQIASSKTDLELTGLAPIGWFLSHTRGSLELTESEANQFDRFFPESLRLTVLVKPERFQPTRYGFLLRRSDGHMPREATSQAVILPLPGRSHQSGELMPSIAAPTSHSKKISVTSARLQSEREECDDETALSVTPEFDQAARFTSKIPPEAGAAQLEEGATDPLRDFRTAEERATRRQLARERVRVMEQAFSAAPSVPPSYPPQTSSLPADADLPSAGIPAHSYSSASSNESVKRPAFFPQGSVALEYRPGIPGAPRQPIINTRSVTALSVASLLGCLAGYIGYLQLPAPVIPLEVHAANRTIVVSWPPRETRNSIYATMRFNDGVPVPLSAEEKTNGQVSLAATSDFKVEVMARNWARDSRGILRYMHSPNSGGQLIQPDNKSAP